MFAAKEIASDHKDLIHDVAFDFHGRRMATCSSDQTVKVCVNFYIFVISLDSAICWLPTFKGGTHSLSNDSGLEVVRQNFY